MRDVELRFYVPGEVILEWYGGQLGLANPPVQDLYPVFWDWLDAKGPNRKGVHVTVDMIVSPRLIARVDVTGAGSRFQDLCRFLDQVSRQIPN